ncbi:ATP-binding protein [Leptolyngbya sp. AN03gr2]|uniref:sensor histidine kinase n=1 Tax=unclassified Leptolyngbya TaxID=2650499 RepID=UPI003D320474
MKLNGSSTSESTKPPANHVVGVEAPITEQPTKLGFFWAARTRILFWYVVILLFIFLASIPAFRYLLSSQVDRRVRDDSMEKIDTFKSLLNGELIDEENVELDEPSTQQAQSFQKPYSKEELANFFDAYLSRQIPEDDIYIMTFVDGQFHKSSPRARPDILKRDSALVQRWAKQTKAEEDKHLTNDRELGDVLYIVEPVKVRDQTLGVLVVAHTTGGEQAEAIEAVSVIIKVIAVALLIALVLAWFASGRVLLPLRSLSHATRLINESDLSQRLTIQGTGQVADLGHSFNEMMDRLQAAFVSQRNFINDAGHELRTPITIIQGHLELMGDDPEEQQEVLTIVMDELDRMTRFVDDLILLAKSERPDFLQLEQVEVHQLTEEIFTKVQALADRNWTVEGTAKGDILLDRQRITQAVMNLAQNATQFTQVHDTIAIGSAISKGKLHFWVRDTGEGIAVTDQRRIFDRFARAANSRRRSEGAGLGLSIVQSIAEAHGGEVHVRSQPGQGATFSIVLPVQPQEQPQ